MVRGQPLCLSLNIRTPEDGAHFRSSHELIVCEGHRGVKGDLSPAQRAAAVRGRGLKLEGAREAGRAKGVIAHGPARLVATLRLQAERTLELAIFPGRCACRAAVLNLKSCHSIRDGLQRRSRAGKLMHKWLDGSEEAVRRLKSLLWGPGGVGKSMLALKFPAGKAECGGGWLRLVFRLSASTMEQAGTPAEPSQASTKNFLRSDPDVDMCEHSESAGHHVRLRNTGHHVRLRTGIWASLARPPPR